MNLRRLICLGVPAMLILTQSGCATTILSQKISRDHKRLIIHHLDEDRVYKVNAAEIQEPGDLRILYSGAQGPRYKTRSYRMALSSRRLETDSTRISPEKADSDPRLVPIAVSRRVTRHIREPGTESGPHTLPVIEVQQLRDLDMETLRRRARERDEKICVVYSPALKSRSLPGKPRGKGPVSTGIGILLIADPPTDPAVLVVPHVPRKSTLDFSGLGYRCLYPFALVWDVATFPVQALAVVWALEDASGGWLF